MQRSIILVRFFSEKRCAVADVLLPFLFEGADVRGAVVSLDTAWREVLTRHAYPLPVRTLLGEAMAASVLLSSTLKADLNYTPSSAFETFPFPYPVTDAQREAVALASRALIARRSEICLERPIGLTKLYNQMDEGAWADLRALHRRLDEAVAAAYGWPASIAQDADETNRRLLELNRAITAGERPYAPFE